MTRHPLCRVGVLAQVLEGDSYHLLWNSRVLLDARGILVQIRSSNYANAKKRLPCVANQIGVRATSPSYSPLAGTYQPVALHLQLPGPLAGGPVLCWQLPRRHLFQLLLITRTAWLLNLYNKQCASRGPSFSANTAISQTCLLARTQVCWTFRRSWAPSGSLF